MTYFPDLNSNLIPGNDGYDIGSPSKKWQDGYFSGSLSVGSDAPLTSLYIIGDGYFAGYARVSETSKTAAEVGAGAIRLASSGTELEFSDGVVWYPVSTGAAGANTSLSNLSTTSINTDLLPSIDDGYSLGSPSLRWKDGYFANNSLHIVSTSGETGVATDWNLSVIPDGYFNISNVNDGYLTITNFGNVGIGTTQPADKLTVDGYVKAIQGFRFGDNSIMTTASGGGGGTPAGSNGAIQFNDSGSFGADSGNLFWDNTNNRLGLGTTTPGAPLGVVGGADFIDSTDVIINLITTTNTTSSQLYLAGDQASSTWTVNGSAIPGSQWGIANSNLNALITQFGPLQVGTLLNHSLSFGTNNTERQRFDAVEAVFNETGANYDFRIEGDTDGYLFFVDASTNRVGIGTNIPQHHLHVLGASVDERIVSQTTNTSGMAYVTARTGPASAPDQQISLAAFGAAVAGTTMGYANADAVMINTAVASRMFIISNSSAPIIIGPKGTEVLTLDGYTFGMVHNESAADLDARFEGTTNANLLFVDASANSVGIGTNTPSSIVQINGSMSLPITTKTADYTATIDDYTILCNASTGIITITLPTAVGIGGRIYVIKKIDSSANAITIDGNGSETIDGAATQVLSAVFESMTIQSNGTAWYII